VEIILIGFHGLTCKLCHGDGYLPTSRGFCTICSGTGVIRNPEYEEAATILGLDYPDSIDWVIEDD
jgi:RecJ-like exonuclease